MVCILHERYVQKNEPSFHDVEWEVSALTAVIYARYSSDKQREESIEGQIRECTAYAEKNGIIKWSALIFSMQAGMPSFRQMYCWHRHRSRSFCSLDWQHGGIYERPRWLKRKHYWKKVHRMHRKLHRMNFFVLSSLPWIVVVDVHLMLGLNRQYRSCCFGLEPGRFPGSA